MTVGITTFHFCTNYGAVLQATALVRRLHALGLDARLIDRRSFADRQGHLRVFRDLHSPRDLAHNLLKLARFRSWSRRLRRTEAFIASHQRLTPERYRDVGDTVDRWPEMDAYVTGSDQVWNVETDVNPVSFLLPADPARSRLVSYAASFGTESIPAERRSDVAAALRRFHSISVREASGQNLVESLIGVRPSLQCDPVFLQPPDLYRTLESAVDRPERYIALYAIGVTPDLMRLTLEAKRHLGLPVVQIGPPVAGPSPGCDLALYDAGPAEFLHLMRNAALVCTNSFHGTAFSLLFSRPLLTTVAPRGRNTRIAHLLTQYEEVERQIPADSDPCSIPWDRLLDVRESHWQRVREQEAEAAIRYLGAALEIADASLPRTRSE